MAIVHIEFGIVNATGKNLLIRQEIYAPDGELVREMSGAAEKIHFSDAVQKGINIQLIPIFSGEGLDEVLQFDAEQCGFINNWQKHW